MCAAALVEVVDVFVPYRVDGVVAVAELLVGVTNPVVPTRLMDSNAVVVVVEGVPLVVVVREEEPSSDCRRRAYHDSMDRVLERAMLLVLVMDKDRRWTGLRVVVVVVVVVVVDEMVAVAVSTTTPRGLVAVVSSWSLPLVSTTCSSSSMSEASLS